MRLEGSPQLAFMANPAPLEANLQDNIARVVNADAP
jgi:hypothetical protein